MALQSLISTTYLIDKERTNINALIEVIKHKYPNQSDSVYVGQGDANAYVPKACEPIKNKKARTVMFLDPFATSMSFETVRCIAKTERVDLWTLFPWMAVNRLLPKDPSKKDTYAKVLTKVFGDISWQDVWFRCLFI